MGKTTCKITIHTNQKFNKLTSIKYMFTKKYSKHNYHYYWLFKCDCGKELITNKDSVLKGLTTSCGCNRSEISSKIFTKINLTKEVTKGLVATNRVFDSYKRAAEKRNYVFEINKEEFIKLTSSNCHYCNRIPEQKSYNKPKTDYIIYNGLDRVDNNLGYTLDNTVTCCMHCNRAKMCLSKNQFLQLISDIYKNIIENAK